MEILSEITGAFVPDFAAMGPEEIVAWVFGVLGILISVILYAGKTRKHILVCKLTSDVLWFTNYVLLSQFTGALLNLIAIGRETVFYHRTTKKWASHRIWLYVFIALTLLSPALDLMKGFSWVPFLPAIGSVLAVISFYSRRPLVMRYFGFAAQAFWIAYGIMIRNWPAVASSVLTVISAVIGMIREMRARDKSVKSSKTGSKKAKRNL